MTTKARQEPVLLESVSEEHARLVSSRSSRAVTVVAGTPYAFDCGDFSGAGGRGDLDAVRVIGLEKHGVLTLHGAPVVLNEVVQRKDIQAGHLQFLAPAGVTGENYDSFLFAPEGGGRNADASASMWIHVVAEEAVVDDTVQVADPVDAVEVDGGDDSLDFEEMEFVVVEEFSPPVDCEPEPLSEETSAAETEWPEEFPESEVHLAPLEEAPADEVEALDEGPAAAVWPVEESSWRSKSINPVSRGATDANPSKDRSETGDAVWPADTKEPKGSRSASGTGEAVWPESSSEPVDSTQAVWPDSRDDDTLAEDTSAEDTQAYDTPHEMGDEDASLVAVWHDESSVDPFAEREEFQEETPWPTESETEWSSDADPESEAAPHVEDAAQWHAEPEPEWHNEAESAWPVEDEPEWHDEAESAWPVEDEPEWHDEAESAWHAEPETASHAEEATEWHGGEEWPAEPATEDPCATSMETGEEWSTEPAPFESTPHDSRGGLEDGTSYDVDYCPPTASDTTVETDVDQPYVFRVEDFNYKDFDGDELTYVQVLHDGMNGVLQLDGDHVESEETIASEAIEMGRLEYSAGTFPQDDSFQFRVHDGTAFSDQTYTMTVVVTEVDAVIYDAPTCDSPVADSPPVDSSPLDSSRLDSSPLDSSVYDSSLQEQDFSAPDFDVHLSGSKPKIESQFDDDDDDDEVAGFADSGFHAAVTTSPHVGDEEEPHEDSDGEAVAQVEDEDQEVLEALLASTEALQAAKRKAGMIPVPKVAESEPNDPTASGAKPAAADAEPAKPRKRPRRVYELCVGTPEDEAYVFSARDLSPDANPIAEIQVLSVEVCGLLQLDGMAVIPGQRIRRRDLKRGRLSFVPAKHGRHKYFEFRVRRGPKWSMAVCTMVVDVQPAYRHNKPELPPSPRRRG